MGLLKFRLTPPELSETLPELRRAYFTGLDRTPEALGVELRPGLLVCHRDSPDSGRLHVPFPVEGYGLPFVGTATLAERPTPYGLAVELARGKLNDVRGQAADWRHLGLQLPGGRRGTARQGAARLRQGRDLVARPGRGGCGGPDRRWPPPSRPARG